MKEEQESLFEKRIQCILDNKPVNSRRPTPLQGKKLNPKQTDAIKEFHNFLKTKQRTAKTRYNHLDGLRRFFLTTKIKLADVTEKDIIDYLSKKEKSSKTEWTYLNNFFIRIGKPEVTKELKPETKKKKIIKDFLIPKEVAKMISCAEDFRTKALISIMMDAGIRVGEVIALKVKHLEPDEYGMKLIIPEGKTGERVVRLTDCIPDIRNLLNSFKFKIETPEGLMPDPEAYLFYALQGYNQENKNKEGIASTEKTINNTERKKKGLSYTGAYNLIKKIATTAQISKNVHPHIFRHSRAHQLLMEGWDVHEVKEHLGHSSITSTEVYLNYSKEDYDNAVLKRKGLINENGKKLEKDKSLDSKRCFRCEHENPGHVQYCEHCNSPITPQAIKKMDKINQVTDDLNEGYLTKKDLNMNMKEYVDKYVEELVKQRIKELTTKQ